MSPAPRRPANRALPPNLYTHSRGGFRYRRPDGSYVYLGHDRAKAIGAALAANAHFGSKTSLFEKIVAADIKTLRQVIGDYLEKMLPKLEIGEDTRKGREWCLKKIQASDLASAAIEDIETRDIYLYLETLASDWTRQSHRALLMQVFKWAIGTGLRRDNPVSEVMRPNAKRARLRLSLEHFVAIRARAAPWLQNAMDLGLHTLQRPGDVVLMRWEDLTPTALRIVQRKTGRKLELEITTPLRAVLNRCRDDVLSPFIVHRLPEKARPQHMRAKSRQHHTQVLLEQAERAFDAARIACGLYGPKDSPPTLHEIRSLGGALYREAGWSEAEVQRLMGHSEVQMTRHYLKGHEAPWERVAAGLSLPAIRY